MKTYKVYEIYDIYGNILYVGHTSRKLSRRLKEHTYSGKIKVEAYIFEIGLFDNKKEARQLEDYLQNLYGFITDTEKRKISASIGSKKRWDNTDTETRSIINSESAIKRWNSKSKEDRSLIIKKGHETRKLKKQQKYVNI